MPLEPSSETTTSTRISPNVADACHLNGTYSSKIPYPFTLRSVPLYQCFLFLRCVMSTAQYHIHTLILFTWTDYKTILVPVVNLLLQQVRVGSRVVSQDFIWLRHSPLHSISNLVWGVAWIMATPAHLQHLQSSKEPGRRRDQSSLATPSIRKNHRNPSDHASLGYRGRLPFLVLVRSLW